MNDQEKIDFAVTTMFGKSLNEMTDDEVAKIFEELRQVIDEVNAGRWSHLSQTEINGYANLLVVFTQEALKRVERKKNNKEC